MDFIIFINPISFFYPQILDHTHVGNTSGNNHIDFIVLTSYFLSRTKYD